MYKHKYAERICWPQALFGLRAAGASVGG